MTVCVSVPVSLCANMWAWTAPMWMHTVCILALRLCRYPHVFFDGVTHNLLLVVAFLLFQSRCRGGMEGSVGSVVWVQTKPDQRFPDSMFLFMHNEVWLSAGLHALATAAILMAYSKEKYASCHLGTINVHTDTRWCTVCVYGF